MIIIIAILFLVFGIGILAALSGIISKLEKLEKKIDKNPKIIAAFFQKFLEDIEKKT